ncbi:MAG: PEP-CTERM sorting domain-containing protein [Acetobacteraceae bacterium]
MTLSLTNVVFDDGGTAFGNIWLNTYGYVERSNVVTTPGSTLAGQSFAYPPGAVAPNYLTDPGGNNWIVLFDNAYNQALWLEVETRPDQQQLTGTDRILGGCETATYALYCPAQLLDTRYINTEYNPYLAVPEPLSLAVLGSGLLGAHLGRRTRRRPAA